MQIQKNITHPVAFSSAVTLIGNTLRAAIGSLRGINVTQDSSPEHVNEHAQIKTAADNVTFHQSSFFQAKWLSGSTPSTSWFSLISRFTRESRSEEASKAIIKNDPVKIKMIQRSKKKPTRL